MEKQRRSRKQKHSTDDRPFSRQNRRGTRKHKEIDHSAFNFQNISKKKHKRQTNMAQLETKGKTIQWKENKTTNFNPQQPVAFTLPPQPT